LIQPIVLHRFLTRCHQRVEQERHGEDGGQPQRQRRGPNGSTHNHNGLVHVHDFHAPWPLHACASRIRRCSAGWVASNTSDQRGGQSSTRFWQPIRCIAVANEVGSHVSWSAKR